MGGLMEGRPIRREIPYVERGQEVHPQPNPTP